MGPHFIQFFSKKPVSLGRIEMKLIKKLLPYTPKKTLNFRFNFDKKFELKL